MPLLRELICLDLDYMKRGYLSVKKICPKINMMKELNYCHGKINPLITPRNNKAQVKSMIPQILSEMVRYQSVYTMMELKDAFPYLVKFLSISISEPLSEH